METFETLAFKTEKQANKNLQDIKSYFKSRLIDSKVFRGTDERGNYGFQIKYILSK